MDNDDVNQGRILSRREALIAVGAAGFTLFTGRGFLGLNPASQAVAVPCIDLVAAPAQTEGPFFVDENLNRSDLLGDTTRPSVVNGLPFQLRINVYELTGEVGCPLPGAYVDVWYCDAIGVYSDAAAGDVQEEDTIGQTWLRGFQITDADGQVTFNGIYPGFYSFRTVHIHFKIRRFDESRQVTYDFTSQLYFDEAVNDEVLANAPYNSRGDRVVHNIEDGIYSPDLIVNVTDSGIGKLATFSVGIDSTQATPTPTPGPTVTLCDSSSRGDGDFDSSGCSDLNDFLYLLDNWQTDPGCGPIGINDFLSLLDNWQSGPIC